MKIIKQIKTVILFLFLFTSSLISSQTGNWNEDLEIYYAKLTEKHIDIFNKIDKEVFEKELHQIKISAKAENDFQTILKLMKLTKQIGDGHTSVSLRNLKTHSYPLEIRFIDNQWRVVKITEANKQLLSTSLIAIDGVPIEEVSAKISEIAQFVENKYSKIVRTGSYLTISELLFSFNITKKKQEAVFTFLNEHHKKINITLKALDKTTMDSVDFIELSIGVPQISKPKNSMFDYLWFAPIKNTKALYINFESYPSFEEMQVFGEKLVTYIAKNNIQQIIIDMRNNGGGDLYVGVVLAYALNLADSIDWKQGVYVLSSNITFSAGASNTALFKQLLNAKIIGQPTGSNPRGYQDMDQFELPNSKLIITYSKRYFKLSEKLTQGVQPDVLLNYNWNDYKNGTDTMIQWIINDFQSYE
jgi:hypothetical protein